MDSTTRSPTARRRCRTRQREVGTIVWFAARTHADTFWIFDDFPDEAARDAHANGAIVAALMAVSTSSAQHPDLAADVLASKLP